MQVQVHQHYLARRELVGDEQLVLQSVHLWTSQRKTVLTRRYCRPAATDHWLTMLAATDQLSVKDYNHTRCDSLTTEWEIYFDCCDNVEGVSVKNRASVHAQRSTTRLAARSDPVRATHAISHSTSHQPSSFPSFFSLYSIHFCRLRQFSFANEKNKTLLLQNAHGNRKPNRKHNYRRRR